MYKQKDGQDDHSKRPSLELIIEGKKFEWFEQFNYMFAHIAGTNDTYFFPVQFA